MGTGVSHARNRDQFLDRGGPNEISAAEVVSFKEGSIQFLIDGGGTAISTGVQGWVRLPFDVTIKSASLLADQSGDIQIDINKENFSTHNSSSTNSITGGNPLIISSSNKVEDLTLTGWTTSLLKGDILYFEVDSILTIEKCLVELILER